MTGSNGLPDAKMHRPSVYLTASASEHSDLEDGFESGKMIGRALRCAIFVRICGVKAPPMVDRPSSMVGRTVSMREESEEISCPSLSVRAK